MFELLLSFKTILSLQVLNKAPLVYSYNYRTRYNKLNVAASNGWITGRKSRRARVERRQNDVAAINLTDNAALM